MLAYLVILYFCALVQANCPNGCGDSASCCEVQPNKFSCCPYTNGVCCADSKHCCPQGSVCDASGLTCKYPIGPQWPVRSLYDPDAIKETGEEVPAEKPPPYIICPDRLSFCSKENTCCPMTDGRWGCCKHPQGICCSNGGHCCPANTKCNAEDRTCLPLLAPDSNLKEKVNASPSSGLLPTGKEEEEAGGGRRLNASNHACDASGKYSCPDSSTCCRENTGDWGCCPLQSAVCCSDGLHCCPKNTVCDLKTGSCTSSLMSSYSSSMLDPGGRLAGSDEKKAPVHLPTLVNDSSSGSEQMCADRKTRCPDHATCCRLADLKSYGCCPLDEGVCCLDGLHCCPKDFTCNLKEGTCVGDAHSSSASSQLVSVAQGDVLTPSEKQEEGEMTNTCPGGLVSCPSGSCCPTALGNYRCCPYKSGVCCPDLKHCCPPNSVCTGAGGCLPVGDPTAADQGRAAAAAAAATGGDRVSGGPIATTVITGRGKPVDVVFCPGQDFYCPNATTCCPGGSDTSWSCCPHQKAVCCADRSHCCPLGTSCSPTHRGCIPVLADSLGPVNQDRLQPSTRVSELSLSGASLAPSTCPDQETVCDDHMPCCQLVGGQWGCCPLANGVCCADGNHCCPLGTRCSKDGYCAPKEAGHFYTAPFLIPGRQVGSGQREETFLQGVKPTGFHFPLAKVAQPATRDLMLLSASYRRMKEFHHSVCPSGVQRCAEDEQCCPSDRHGYTCAPKTSTCCSPVLDTICPVDKACSSFGMICNPV